MKNFVVVKTYSTQPESELAKGLLELNSIQAIIAADDEGGMLALSYSSKTKI